MLLCLDATTRDLARAGLVPGEALPTARAAHAERALTHGRISRPGHVCESALRPLPNCKLFPAQQFTR